MSEGKFLSSRAFRIYFVPGAVFQSVMIGGGYGTGREIVEYFSSYGFFGGLLAMSIAFTALALVLAVTFEFSRVFRAYDYRNFFKHLLGKGWMSFEVLIILQFILILAVLGSAAGNILHDNFALPYALGIVAMLTMVGILTFFGREVIARTLTIWTLILYVVLILFFVTVFNGYRIPPLEELMQADIQHGWFRSGLQYALYNLAVAPLLLYVARDFQSSRETVSCGIIAGALATIPALVFHVGFAIAPREVLDQAIPVYWMMVQLGATTLLLVYSVMLMGTFVETGAGMLQGINERIDGYLREKSGVGLSRAAHAGIAIAAILVSTALSHLGITRLIAEGYGTMAWGFLLVYVVPLLTIGIYRIIKYHH